MKRQCKAGFGVSMLRKSLNYDAAAPAKPSLSPTPSRKTSTNEKRKVSRVHRGRMHFLNDADEPDPVQPVSKYDFFMAASSGKIKTVRKYLDDGGDVNAMDSCQRTALHRASLYEQQAIVDLLLQRGADVNSSDKLLNTPLHWACRGTKLEIVQLLMSYNAKVNTRDKLRNAPIHVATRVGFVECVDYLLECGADINMRDSEGDTPIHDAVRLGRPKVVRSLILHGADMSSKNKSGKTAVDMVQVWYNNTKEALHKAEEERIRKGINVEKLADEMDIDSWDGDFEFQGSSCSKDCEKDEQTSEESNEPSLSQIASSLAEQQINTNEMCQQTSTNDDLSKEETTVGTEPKCDVPAPLALVETASTQSEDTVTSTETTSPPPKSLKFDLSQIHQASVEEIEEIMSPSMEQPEHGRLVLYHRRSISGNEV